MKKMSPSCASPPTLPVSLHTPSLFEQAQPRLGFAHHSLARKRKVLNQDHHFLLLLLWQRLISLEKSKKTTTRASEHEQTIVVYGICTTYSTMMFAHHFLLVRYQLPNSITSQQFEPDMYKVSAEFPGEAEDSTNQGRESQYAPTMGSVNEIVVPGLTSATQIAPPCATIKPLQIARPSPTPFDC